MTHAEYITTQLQTRNQPRNNFIPLNPRDNIYKFLFSLTVRILPSVNRTQIRKEPFRRIEAQDADRMVPLQS